MEFVSRRGQTHKQHYSLFHSWSTMRTNDINIFIFTIKHSGVQNRSFWKKQNNCISSNRSYNLVRVSALLALSMTSGNPCMFETRAIIYSICLWSAEWAAVQQSSCGGQLTHSPLEEGYFFLLNDALNIPLYSIKWSLVGYNPPIRFSHFSPCIKWNIYYSDIDVFQYIYNWK